MELFTIGYEGHTIVRVLETLTDAGINMLVDVRQLPLSRKSGFSKNALAANVQDKGIAYLHIAALGCPKAIRDAYRSDHDWKKYTRDFLAYLHTQDAAISALNELVPASRCCLLCFEADPLRCHRTYVAERVRDTIGSALTIIHLTNPAAPELNERSTALVDR